MRKLSLRQVKGQIQEQRTGKVWQGRGGAQRSRKYLRLAEQLPRAQAPVKKKKKKKSEASDRQQTGPFATLSLAQTD